MPDTPSEPSAATEALAEPAAGFIAALRLPGGDPATRARASDTAHRLLGRWAEPHRRYHTLTHLTATLEAVRLLLAAPDGEPGDLDPGDLELAVWFHDAVYRGEPGRDEEASADLAVAELGALGLSAARVVEVARLVRLTRTHRPSADDRAGQILCDADLSVLAAPEPEYRAYARAVRQEYAHVPAAEFRAGRAAVLTGLGRAPQIFRTARGRRLWEASARANVAAELARLADPNVPLDGEDGLNGRASGAAPA